MYYPKSQITPNLYTNGGEFIYTDTQEEYLGFYFKISTGKYYTGRNQDDRPNRELSILISSQTIPTPTTNNFIPSFSSTTNIYEQINEEYLNIKFISPTSLLIPIYNPVLPTNQDYQNGEFRRLFCKKTNEIQYIEINAVVYNQLIAKDSQILWELYEPFNITWQLTGTAGDVARINYRTVESISKRRKLPKLGEYLKSDYIKYYK
jgi:hypothetical protein